MGSGLAATGRRLWAARTAGDEGLTLVEVIVTVALIAIVMSAFAFVFYNTLNASSNNGARQNASVLATSIISKLSASGYENVGFTTTTLTGTTGIYGVYSAACPTGYGNGTCYYWDSDNDGDYTGTTADNDSDSASEQLVTVGTQPAFTIGPNAVTFAPVTAVTTGGTPFTITTHIVWASSETEACPGDSPSTTPLAQAYKRVFVTVTWQHGSLGRQTVQQDSLIYPGGRGTYKGPSYVPSDVPPTPTVTPTPQSTAGWIKVSWPLPSGYTNPTSAGGPNYCYAVGWSNVNDVGFSTGLLPNATYPMTVSGPVGSQTASVVVKNLLQGAAGQAYVFYVTAYDQDGVESAESNDTQQSDAPLGPVITSIAPNTSPPSGVGGGITLQGENFLVGSATSGTMNVQLCRANSASCPVGTSFPYSAAASCPTASTCTATLTMPSAPPSLTAASYLVMGETPTGTSGGEISSPPLPADEYTYAPVVSSIVDQSSPPSQAQTGSAGDEVQVTGSNLLSASTTFNFTNGTTEEAAPLVGTSCPTEGSVCDITVPSGFASGTQVDIIATNGTVSSAVSSGDKFTYR